MDRKRILKIILLLFTILIVSIIFNNVKVDAFSWTDEIETLDAGETSKANDSISNIVSTVISVLRVVGTGVAIIMLAVVAMKYMTAAPGDKADIKKHAVVYVVGAVVLFGVSGILGIIASFAGSIKASGA